MIDMMDPRRRKITEAAIAVNAEIDAENRGKDRARMAKWRAAKKQKRLIEGLSYQI
jgi:hypothetical protein